MMIEQHYDEEVLAEFLGEPNDTVARDKHLATCTLCLKTLDSLRTTAQTLTEPAVWDRTQISTAPRAETLAFLRGMQKTMRDEDAQAAVWIKALLAGPRETWAPRLAEHPEWRTGGMVRRLLKAGNEVIDTMPADAAEITRAAVEVAQTLATTSAARQLLGVALYDHAFALWSTGDLSGALAALQRVDETLADVPVGEFNRARADVLRAMIYQVMERRIEALDIAERSVQIFSRFGDVNRVAAARTVAAATLQSSQRHQEALQLYSEIASSKQVDTRWHVSALHNMAICHCDLGNLKQAEECLGQAIAGHEQLGTITSRSKARWALADLLTRSGRYEQAVTIYRELRDEFQEVGMANDVAMVALDLAEPLLALDRTSEIPTICKEAIAYFVSSGLSQTEPALRALSYLNEASVAGKLTPARIEDVRAFLRAPERHPEYLWLDPPTA